MQAKLPLAAELLEHVHKVFVDSSVENSSEAMISNNKLARTYHLMGRWDEAIARLRTSIQLVESGAAVDVEPGFLTVTKRMLGLALARAGKLAESEQLLKEILPEQTRILGAIHPETITTARALATQLFEKGEHQQALDQFEKHLGTASAMAGLGISYMAVGRSAEALDLLENALAIYKDVYVPGHVDTMVIMSTLGQSYIAAGKLDDATKILTEVQTLAETHLAADHPMQIAAISNLFTAHHKSGRYDEAVRLRERALAEKRKLLCDTHRSIIMEMNNLANSYQMVGRLQDAVTMHKQTVTARIEQMGELHPYTWLAMSNLSGSYLAIGRVDGQSLGCLFLD